MPIFYLNHRPHVELIVNAVLQLADYIYISSKNILSHILIYVIKNTFMSKLVYFNMKRLMFLNELIVIIRHSTVTRNNWKFEQDFLFIFSWIIFFIEGCYIRVIQNAETLMQFFRLLKSNFPILCPCYAPNILSFIYFILYELLYI